MLDMMSPHRTFNIDAYINAAEQLGSQTLQLTRKNKRLHTPTSGSSALRNLANEMVGLVVQTVGAAPT
jgi:hypothetical protein